MAAVPTASPVGGAKEEMLEQKFEEALVAAAVGAAAPFGRHVAAAVAAAAIGAARRAAGKAEPSVQGYEGTEMEQRLAVILAGLKTQQLLSPDGAEPLSLAVRSLRGLLSAFNLAKHQGERRGPGRESEDAEDEFAADEEAAAEEAVVQLEAKASAKQQATKKGVKGKAARKIGAVAQAAAAQQRESEARAAAAAATNKAKQAVQAAEAAAHKQHEVDEAETPAETEATKSPAEGRSSARGSDASFAEVRSEEEEGEEAIPPQASIEGTTGMPAEGGQQAKVCYKCSKLRVFDHYTGPQWRKPAGVCRYCCGYWW